MYAALFEMESMFGQHQYICKGTTPREVMQEFDDIQSLECLVRHGRYEENAQGQLALDKIEEIYIKYISGGITMEDISTLDVKISLGTIKCLAIAEGEKSVDELVSQHSKALRR